MIPKKLHLKHFIGIKAGLGRDEITIDFEHLAGDSKLIALVGVNGAGKSTILDNSHPFRVMPSRAGGYSPGSFSYFDNIYGTDAAKTFEWEHNGVHYRTSLVFKMPGKTKKQEAYLHQLNGDDWVPVVAADGMVSDGKTTTYDKVLESIVGTSEMFFSSAFASQGRRPLSAYGNGEIKGLLSELLGLDHVRELGEKAKAVSKQLTVRLDGMRGDIERVASAEHEQSTKQQELAEHKTALDTHARVRQQARLDVNESTRKLADLQALKNNNTETEIRRNTLLDRQRAITSALQKQLSDIDQDIANETARLEDARKFNADEQETAHQNIADLRNNITRHQQILSQKAAIEAAVNNAPDLVTRYDAANLFLATKQGELAAYRKMVNDRSPLTERMAALEREGTALSARVADLEARGALVDEVPCANTDMQCECQLLANATQARASIPGVIKERDTRRTEYRTTKSQKEAIDKQILEFGDIQAEVARLESDVQAIQSQIAENNKLAALADTLSNTEDAIKSAESQIAAIELRTQAGKDDLAKIEQAVQSRARSLHERKVSIKDVADTEIKGVRQELTALPDPTDTNALVESENAVETADRRLSEIERAVENANTQIARLEGELSALSCSLRDAAQVKALAATVESEITHWSMLAKAMSNDGIISLSIDDAGPTLASLTNDLLLACFGPRFSIRLDTQRQTAKGDMKEAFDITVFDAERDDEKSVSSMSGGEKIWINEAITRAMALYLAQQSGQHYDCLFSDESDGALDPERKQQFMDMKRKVLELGGYQSEIFISHTPELWGMADTVIDMEGFRQ